MSTYRTYNTTPGAFIPHTFPVSRIFNPLGVESWFTPTIGFIGNMTAYTIEVPAIGTYSIEFTELADGDEIIWTIELVVVPELLSLYENCCGDRNIAWLNIQGGWQNYVFSGVKTFQVEIGGAKTFKTNQLVSKYSQIDGVYNGEVISTGDIPQSHVDTLDGLKYAIQALLYNEETEAWDIPILVDVDSFTKYRSRDKFFEVRLKFIYAEEILVQTQ